MELSGDIPVTLIIKAPNQRMADQTVDCMLGWTIKKLKQHLETVYPSKPKHNEQRLIYSGRLLQDHLTLKEILRQYDSTFSDTHTVHLVCSSLMESSSSTNSFSSQKMSQVTATSPKGNLPSLSDQTHRPLPLDAGQTEGVRYRGHGQVPEPSTNPGSISANSAHSVPQTDFAEGGMTAGFLSHPYSAEQYAWMMQQQQIYSQYMMQYMQYYQSVFNQSQSFNPLTSPSQFMQQSAVTNPLPQQQPQVQEAAAVNNGAAAAGRPNVQMNAQGGMEENDEEGEPRDWLHHAYFFMRFLTFMAILIFYSSLARFIVVFSGCFVIYILQRFRNYLQKAYRDQEVRQQQQNNQQQPQHEQEVRQQQQNNQQQPQHEQEEQEQPEVRQEQGQEDVPPPEPGVNNDQQQQTTGNDVSQTTRIFVFICNTIQAFFTSLIPAPPDLLQPN